MKQHFAIGLTPDQSNWQSAPQFTACRLVANAAVETGTQHMQFGLRPGAFEPEHQTIIEQSRMIDAVSIADQSIGGAAEIEQPIPVGVIARQPRDFQSEHDANVPERDFGGHLSEAGTLA
jgi:hypothetical protein